MSFGRMNMALANKREELLAAWRALAPTCEKTGWSTIPIFNGRPLIYAGRHFPENEEALLVGFHGVSHSRINLIPQSQGFHVIKTIPPDPGSDLAWISLSRLPAGNLDLFSFMVEDLIITLINNSESKDGVLFELFIKRIRAWQDFMQRGDSVILSREAETGLSGELEVLDSILKAGFPPSLAMDFWKGPVKGVQDFIFDQGAIEVKSTLSPTGFSAYIDSIEQLDDSFVKPLFLACVRFEISDLGISLPEKISCLRDVIANTPSALNTFNLLLISAGYFDATQDKYVRKFICSEEKYFPITGDFPRIIRSDVPKFIKNVRYEVDIDFNLMKTTEFSDVLTSLGVNL